MFYETWHHQFHTFSKIWKGRMDFKPKVSIQNRVFLGSGFTAVAALGRHFRRSMAMGLPYSGWAVGRELRGYPPTEQFEQ